MSAMSSEINGNPAAIIVISGKRKSGKDYVANLLNERLGFQSCAIIRLSGPLKERYALENNLNYEKLLDASEYKELHRQKMIKWGEEIRNKDPSYFCRHAVQQSSAETKEIWIVSDARRKSDIMFFLDNFSHATITVRIIASEVTRTQRGWIFTKGVDDCESECGLDEYKDWNFIIQNNQQKELIEAIEKLCLAINAKKI